MQMGAITQQPQVFMDYLERLERQNRMLKRLGVFLFLLCFLAIGLMAWQLKRVSHLAAPLGQAKIISATEFHLRDENGKLQGVLAASPDGAMLFLNGPNNKTGLLFNPGPSGSSLSLMSSDGEQQLSLHTDNAFSWVTIGPNEGTGDKIEMFTGGGASNVTLSDKAGFQAVLGRASLVKPESGETRNTSVAALTLFGKDGHILWMTPKPY
jgi:hypothetical protein